MCLSDDCVLLKLSQLAPYLHLLQQRPSSYVCSVSGQWSSGHITPAQSVGSALLFMPIPPLKPSAHERSSGTFTVFAQHIGQQVPLSFAATNSNGGLQSMAAHAMPVQ